MVSPATVPTKNNNFVDNIIDFINPTTPPSKVTEEASLQKTQSVAKEALGSSNERKEKDLKLILKDKDKTIEDLRGKLKEAHKSKDFQIKQQKEKIQDLENKIQESEAKKRELENKINEPEAKETISANFSSNETVKLYNANPTVGEIKEHLESLKQQLNSCFQPGNSAASFTEAFNSITSHNTFINGISVNAGQKEWNTFTAIFSLLNEKKFILKEYSLYLEFFTRVSALTPDLEKYKGINQLEKEMEKDANYKIINTDIVKPAKFDLGSQILDKQSKGAGQEAEAKIQVKEEIEKKTYIQLYNSWLEKYKALHTLSNTLAVKIQELTKPIEKQEDEFMKQIFPHNTHIVDIAKKSFDKLFSQYSKDIEPKKEAIINAWNEAEFAKLKVGFQLDSIKQKIEVWEPLEYLPLQFRALSHDLKKNRNSCEEGVKDAAKNPEKFSLLKAGYIGSLTAALKEKEVDYCILLDKKRTCEEALKELKATLTKEKDKSSGQVYSLSYNSEFKRLVTNTGNSNAMHEKLTTLHRENIIDLENRERKLTSLLDDLKVVINESTRELELARTCIKTGEGNTGDGIINWIVYGKTPKGDSETYYKTWLDNPQKIPADIKTKASQKKDEPRIFLNPGIN